MTEPDWTRAFRAGLASCDATPLGPVDWAGIEARLGHPLPADYRALMEWVGPGGLDGELWVLAPEAEPPRRSVAGNVGRRLSNEPGIDWDRRCFFMVDGNGNEAAWRRDGPDPDLWPLELFVHEEEDAPVAWAPSLRALLLAVASPAGLHHPGFQDKDQFLRGGHVRYAG